MAKIIEIAGIDPGGSSLVFYWDAKSSTVNPDNISLWDSILEYAKENGLAIVFTNNTNDFSGNFIKVLGSQVPTTAKTQKFQSDVGTVSSSGTKITIYKGSVNITVDSNLKVTEVSGLSNSISTYVSIYRFFSPTTPITTMNTTEYLVPGSWGLRLAISCAGTPITISEVTPVTLETKTTYSDTNATYAPYIRQDIYIPSLDRHWYRIVNYAASNNITYGEWKEIDLAFEIVD